MKTKTSIFIITCLALLALFSGCKKDKDSIPTITMTTTISGNMSIGMAGSGTFSIDWGDGSAIETHTLQDYLVSWHYSPEYHLVHNFFREFSCTITITGENITHLKCDNNQLTTLDVSKSTSLKELYCNNNQLKNLNISKNTMLQILNCYGNQITILDVNKNTKLTELRCSMNQLTSLDVSYNTSLQILDCFANLLTSLDVGNNTLLWHLDCSGNELTRLDVSNNVELRQLLCTNNQMTSSALDTLFETLNNNSGIKTIHIYNNSGTSGCNIKIAENKGWEVNAW